MFVQFFLDLTHVIQELDDFMNGSGDDGVIILSMGTYVKVMPQRVNDLFASVFARLPQKVVWQLPDDSPTRLTDNIKTMSWLPQNDLLGKSKWSILKTLFKVAATSLKLEVS